MVNRDLILLIQVSVSSHVEEGGGSTQGPNGTRKTGNIQLMLRMRRGQCGSPVYQLGWKRSLSCLREEQDRGRGPVGLKFRAVLQQEQAPERGSGSQAEA